MPQISKQSKTQRHYGSSGGVISRIKPIGFDKNDGIKMLVYGQSGSGKTTLWSTFPGPILAIICSGSIQPGELRSIDTPSNRSKIFQVALQQSSEFKEVITHLEQERTSYNTVVLDHASGLQDLVLKEILGIEEIPAQKYWGLASLQQYGQCTLQCKEYLRSLLNLQANVVIIAQERNFNDESSSDMIRPVVGAALSPSLTGWLNPACDYVVQTFKRPRMTKTVIKAGGKETVRETRGKGVEFVIRTEPHDVYMTKFRIPKGTALPEVIVDPDYNKIMDLIRGEP